MIFLSERIIFKWFWVYCGGGGAGGRGGVKVKPLQARLLSQMPIHARTELKRCM